MKENVCIEDVDLAQEKGAKRKLSCMTRVASPSGDNLEFSVVVNFKGMDPYFLRIARDVISIDLSGAVRDVLQDFIETYLTSPEAAPSEVVSRE